MVELRMFTNDFSIQYPLVICDQGGMHKCIPYKRNGTNTVLGYRPLSVTLIGPERNLSDPLHRVEGILPSEMEMVNTIAGKIDKTMYQ